MSKPLNVIALISGGKDSIYSILHCLRNGHRVVALGNVYPLPPKYEGPQDIEVDVEDLDSFMYQTVGNNVIPLYEEALGIPLYRQPILGNAVDREITYGTVESGNAIDETECLVPLLRKIMAAHPEANALSSGAILSTYQRTRVESVALRLGLEPLSFLWQYPELPPRSYVSLLVDMASTGLDARIIKVASGSLDRSFLWQNVASAEGRNKLVKAMARWGMEKTGALLGEGGEFETLVLDGPDCLFRGRIVVGEEDREVITGTGGVARIRIKGAKVEMKMRGAKDSEGVVRIPGLFHSDYQFLCQRLQGEEKSYPQAQQQVTQNAVEIRQSLSSKISLKSIASGQKWTIVGHAELYSTVQEETEYIMAYIKLLFRKHNIKLMEVISTTILLRSMRHFAIVNKVYGGLFSEPNPPARVTIACGDVLPPGYNLVVQLTLFRQQEKIDLMALALHVQSRSYWAPANIGPYSQARAVPLLSLPDCSGIKRDINLVHVAGQIPLVPCTMALPTIVTTPADERGTVIDAECQTRDFITQTTLSLLHLMRIGWAKSVSWWTCAVAYLACDDLASIALKARLAARAWEYQFLGATFPEAHPRPPSQEERDIWDQQQDWRLVCRSNMDDEEILPNWSVIDALDSNDKQIAPFFAAEVEELPRGSAIEWQALLGVTKGPLRQLCSCIQVGSCTDKVYKCTVKNHFSQTIVLLAHRSEIQGLLGMLESLLSKLETPAERGLRECSPGYYGSYSAYLDVAVAGLWDADSYAGVIPCLSLWAQDGQRLAAVLVFQTPMEPEDLDPSNNDIRG